MVKLENLAAEREVVGQLIFVFGQRHEMMSWLLYDVIMMSLSVEAPSGDKTSSEEKDITLLYQMVFNVLYKNYCNLKKRSTFF